MKTKKKGFSLVELICTITIAAIIAAAAAPNVSAYIQNSKLQNYSTALNNLVGELQMQLPQKRYWNWQEVSETAEAILRNEVSRDITSSESGNTTTYTLTNVSTDENIEFELDVTYGVPSGIQQEITIDGRCTDYPSVESNNNKCTVTLKNNYVDKGNYPTITQTINTSNSENGWKSMLNMAGTYGYWTDFFKDSANKKNDFGAEVVDTDGSAFYLNLTDYPAGSCEQVTFTMQRYQITIDNEKTEFGYYDENGNWKYLGNSYSGYNEGDIYSVTKYYYIDDFGTEQP
ncbi:MAG: prepilin-type N-terminal cleavage/methylation domain-containing protein, partial [Ruminococcus sp.]